MIELNLLPDVKLEYVHATKARRRVITFVTVGGVVAVGLVVLFAIYVFAVQPARRFFVDNSIKDESKTLSGITDLDKYLTIQQQLAALPALHEAKPIYSRIISYLPILNPSAPNNIHVTRLVIDSTSADGGLVLEAYGSSYTAATVFESTLKSAQYKADGQDAEALFTDVQMSNTTLGQDANGKQVVTFTVTLTPNNDVFAFDAKNPTVTVPSGNATGSAQSVPSEIFAAGGN